MISTLHTSGAVKSSGAVNKDGVLVIGGGDGVLYGLVRGTTLGDAGADASDADVVYPARVGTPLPDAFTKYTTKPSSWSTPFPRISSAAWWKSWERAKPVHTVTAPSWISPRIAAGAVCVRSTKLNRLELGAS